MEIKRCYYVMLIFFVFLSPLVLSQEKEPQRIRVLIESEYYDIFFTIHSRKNLNETHEYRIQDEETLGTLFYVSGYRRNDGRSGGWRWNVEVNNIPEEDNGSSILVYIYKNKTRQEASSVYKEIFWQIYEAHGLPE